MVSVRVRIVLTFLGKSLCLSIKQVNFGKAAEWQQEFFVCFVGPHRERVAEREKHKCEFVYPSF